MPSMHDVAGKLPIMLLVPLHFLLVLLLQSRMRLALLVRAWVIQRRLRRLVTPCIFLYGLSQPPGRVDKGSYMRRSSTVHPQRLVVRKVSHARTDRILTGSLPR